MFARRLGTVIALVALAFALRSVRLSAFADHQSSQRYEDVYYLPPPEWLPVMSLGYESALADLIWCRGLVYFGEELGARGPARHLVQYTDAILQLAPDLRAAYRWVSIGLVYRPVAATLEDFELGAQYLRRAVQRWPNDGGLRWDLGSYLRFEMAPHIEDPREKDRVLEESAAHLHVAAVKGSGPPWLALNNSTLLNRLGQKELAIRQLEEVYTTVNDEETREQIRTRLAQLRTETYVEAIQAASEAFEAEHEANFPYVSSDMFLILGPRTTGRYAQDVAQHFILDTPL